MNSSVTGKGESVCVYLSVCVSFFVSLCACLSVAVCLVPSTTGVGQLLTARPLDHLNMYVSVCSSLSMSFSVYFSLCHSFSSLFLCLSLLSFSLHVSDFLSLSHFMFLSSIFLSISLA